MEICYVHELSRDNVNDEDDRGGDDAAVITDFGVEMVGNSRLLSTIRDLLLRRMRPDDRCFFSFFGENGSGRTAAAKTIFEDLSKDSDLSFDCYAWVTTGHDQLKEVLISVIAQVAGTGHCEVVDEKQICSYLYKILENRRFMIVLDDVWDVKVVDSLKSFLPDQSNGSLVIVTTSLVEVAETAHSGHSFVLPSNYFREIVWLILRFWVFGDESISEELKEDVNKIIDSFRSLFVLAAKSLLPVLKSGMTLEQWSKIAAANEEDPVFVLEDEISEISKIKTEMQANNWAVDGQRVEVIVELVSRWVNFSGQIETIKAELYTKRFFAKMQIVSLLGMAGIGKSNLVRKIFNDKSVFKHYDYHVWINLGPKYEKEEILTDVLAQIFPFTDKLHLKEDGEFVNELIKKYKNAEANLVTLSALGAAMLHGVDATRMMTLPELRGLKFHRITYNFPHAGFHREEVNPVMVMMHRELVREFLYNASSMLHFDGEIHVSHKTGSPFDWWRIEELGSEFSLICIAQDDFRIEDYPGYDNKRGSGSRADESFHLGPCRTYRFKLCPVAVKNLIMRKLHLIQPQTPMAYVNEGALQNHGSECKTLFGRYLKHVDETFGDTSYDVHSSLDEAMKLGYAAYISSGRPSSGFISILEELHRLSISRSDQLRQMLFCYRLR